MIEIEVAPDWSELDIEIGVSRFEVPRFIRDDIKGKNYEYQEGEPVTSQQLDGEIVPHVPLVTNLDRIDLTMPDGSHRLIQDKKAVVCHSFNFDGSWTFTNGVNVNDFVSAYNQAYPNEPIEAIIACNPLPATMNLAISVDKFDGQVIFPENSNIGVGFSKDLINGKTGYTAHLSLRDNENGTWLGLEQESDRQVPPYEVTYTNRRAILGMMHNFIQKSDLLHPHTFRVESFKHLWMGFTAGEIPTKPKEDYRGYIMVEPEDIAEFSEILINMAEKRVKDGKYLDGKILIGYDENIPLIADEYLEFRRNPYKNNRLGHYRGLEAQDIRIVLYAKDPQVIQEIFQDLYDNYDWMKFERRRRSKFGGRPENTPGRPYVAKFKPQGSDEDIRGLCFNPNLRYAEDVRDRAKRAGIPWRNLYPKDRNTIPLNYTPTE